MLCSITSTFRRIPTTTITGYYYDYYYKSRETEDEPVEDKKDGKEEKLIAQADAAGEDVNPSDEVAEEMSLLVGMIKKFGSGD